MLLPYGNKYALLPAAPAMAVVHVLLLFISFQRYFIEGMAVGWV